METGRRPKGQLARRPTPGWRFRLSDLRVPAAAQLSAGSRDADLSSWPLLLVSVFAGQNGRSSALAGPSAPGVETPTGSPSAGVAASVPAPFC
jgi:hypothetical protein